MRRLLNFCLPVLLALPLAYLAANPAVQAGSSGVTPPLSIQHFLGNISGTVLLDPADGNVVFATVTGPVRWTFPATPGHMFVILQHAGAFQHRWPYNTFFPQGFQGFQPEDYDSLDITSADGTIWFVTQLGHAYRRPEPQINADAINYQACDVSPTFVVRIQNYYGASQTEPYWTTAGDGVFDDPASLTPTYTAGTADIANSGVNVTAHYSDAYNTVSLTIIHPALVDAGPDQTVANEDIITVQLAGSITGDGGRWTSPGDGGFDSSGILTATYQPGPLDKLAGTVTLTLTSNGEVCAPVADTMTITITP